MVLLDSFSIRSFTLKLIVYDPRLSWLSRLYETFFLIGDMQGEVSFRLTLN